MFFCSDDLETLPLLGHNHFLRVYTMVRLLRNWVPVGKEGDQSNEYETGSEHTNYCGAQSSYISPPAVSTGGHMCGLPLSWIKAMTGRPLVCAWYTCCMIHVLGDTCVPLPIQNLVHQSP